MPLDALLAENVESVSELSSVSLGGNPWFSGAWGMPPFTLPGWWEEAFPLPFEVVSAESASEVSIPTLTQKHILLAEYVESVSEVSIPSEFDPIEHVLLADDVESASEVLSLIHI